jgi:hypothetical protein
MPDQASVHSPAEGLTMPAARKAVAAKSKSKPRSEAKRVSAAAGGGASAANASGKIKSKAKEAGKPKVTAKAKATRQPTSSPKPVDWEKRFHSRTVTEVELLRKPFGGMKAGERLVISTPAEIDGYVRTLPPGAAQRVADMRREIASRYSAGGCCPVTSSIFLRIVAERALLQMQNGQANAAPFWRTIEPESPLAGKLSCGREWVAARRAAEANG